MSEDKQGTQGRIETSATRRDRPDEEPRRPRLRDRLSEADLRARSFWIGFAIGAAVVAVVLLVAWPVVDTNFYLRDDRGLGDRFRTQMQLDGYGCERLAEVLYDHGILLSGYTTNDDGYAPRSEKAFYAGCTGADSIPGGD
jgi:hypothetical protein